MSKADGMLDADWSSATVDGLRTLAEAGFDGTLLSWPRYVDDMREFQETIYPLVQQAGLR